MKNFKSKTGNGQCHAEEISTVLFELRDALMELSQALQDLQFETDLEKRKILEGSVQQLLKNIASEQDPPLIFPGHPTACLW